MVHPYRAQPQSKETRNCFYVFHDWVVLKNNNATIHEEYQFICKNCGKTRDFKSYLITDYIKVNRSIAGE